MEDFLELCNRLVGFSILRFQRVVLGLDLGSHVVDFDYVLFSLLLQLGYLPLVLGLDYHQSAFRGVLEALDDDVAVALQLLVLLLPLPLHLRIQVLVLEQFGLEVLVRRELLLEEGLRVLVLTLNVRPAVHPRLVLRQELLIQGGALFLTGS